MSVEENKALARRSWEAMDNPDVLNEFHTPEALWHPPDQDTQSVEEFEQYLTPYKTAFPDLNVSVELTPIKVFAR
jgi:hypothetical protein